MERLGKLHGMKHEPRGIAECVLLYVEDDDPTAYLFQFVLRQNGMSPQFFRVTDGEQATAFLLQAGGYRDAPRPHLVLLDLNLPRKSGFDVLAEMKADARLRDITVIVFSSSTLQYDREKAMELGANDYLHKGGNLDAFAAVAKAVCEKMTGAGPARRAS
jgi:two-component system, chemotaxis family, response regulator Rcp1